MKSVLLISLFILCLSSKKNIPQGQQASDVFAKIKKDIYQCISTSEEASKTLRDFAKTNLNSEGNLPLNFNTIELTQTDREVIKQCKRDAFKSPVRKPDSYVTPISLENIVHRKKVSLVKGMVKKPKKMELLNKIKN